MGKDLLERYGWEDLIDSRFILCLAALGLL